MEDLTKYYSSDAESAMDLDVPLLFLSFPSAKDPNWKLHPGRENKSTMALVTISKWEWFNQWKVNDFIVPTMFSLMHWAYSVVSIKRTGSLNYFETFYHPKLFFHVLNEIFFTTLIRLKHKFQ